MKVSIDRLPESRVQLRVEVTPDEARPFIERAARDLSKEQTPKGFRPGSAPLDVMRGVIGDAKLLERAARELVSHTYVESLLTRADVEAIGRPEVSVERAAFDAPWVYTATVAVLPEAQLGDYRAVRGAPRTVTVDAAEIERELEHLRKLRASYLTVPRAAAVGDRVEADVVATVAGVPLEAAAPQRQVFQLGEEPFVGGFEEHLVGMREGQEKVFTLQFPENHHRADLRGRAVSFRVTMRTIQQRILPELNDHFARGLGQFTSLADLKHQLEAHVREEREARERERFQQELLEQVVARTTFGTLPGALVDHELETMMAELQEGVATIGLTIDVYLGQIKKSRQEVREGLRSQAQARIRAGLTLRALAKAERIAVATEEIEAEVNEALKRFGGRTEAARRLDLDALRATAAAAIRNRKVFATLEAFARKNGTA